MAAIAGTDYQAAGNYATFSYPFPSNATSTNITFSGGLTGALTGNASTATALQTARTINGVSFDGTANIVVTAASSTLLADSNTFSGTNTFLSTIAGSITGNAGTVTNGVYTTTFNGLFDSRFVTDLAATSSIASITTLPNLSLPYSQLTGAPSVAAYPFPSNATTTQIAFNGGLTASNATIAYASTTAISGAMAQFTTSSSSNLVISGITNGTTQCLQINSSGTVSGTGSACGSGGGGGITAIGPAGQTQSGTTITFATTTAGSDFTITAAADTITFNLPIASATNTGKLTATDWAAFNNKISSSSLSAGAGIAYNPLTGVITNTIGYPFPSNATSTSIAFNGGLAGILTGSLVGNASTATSLQTGRTINGVTFDGTQNIVLAAASSTLLADSNVFSGTNTFSNTINASISGNAGTVTNGVYTTTFNTLFDNRLSASSSIAGIVTLPNLSLPYSQLTGAPGASAYPFPLLGNATSTLTQFNAGLTAFASSTIGNGTQAGGLTINGGATTTGMLAVRGTGTSTFAGGIQISGGIMPSADNTYSLGAEDLAWKHVYIGPGSLYVNGQKVISTNGGDDVVISSDPNENLVLQTSGTANIELNPAGGQVQIKNTINVTAGKSITTTDLSALSVPSGVAAGNITILGNSITSSNTNGDIAITPNGNGDSYFTSGNVGIGTTNPGSKLEVQGLVSAQRFTATSSIASVLPYASTTALTVSGALYGAGLSTCNTSVDKLLWNNGVFSCGTDQSSGGGGSDANWTFFNGSGIRLSTSTNQVVIGGTSTSTLLSPLAKLGVFGGASIDYASTTGISASYASTTNLVISGIQASLLKTVDGVVTAAVPGVDYLTSGSTFAYPFPSNATTTQLAFNGGLTATTISSGAATSTSLFGGTVTGNTAAFGQTGSTTIAANGALSAPSLTLGTALGVANGGTGSTTLGGLLTGNGTSIYSSATGTVASSNGITVTAGQAIIGTGLTITGVDAAADDTIKGVASFAAADFNAAAGNISIDYTNGQKATGSQPGFLTALDWALFNNKVSTSSIDSIAEIETLIGGANILTATEVDTSSELAALITDETGSGALVFGTNATLASTTLTGTTLLTNATTTTFAITGILKPTQTARS